MKWRDLKTDLCPRHLSAELLLSVPEREGGRESEREQKRERERECERLRERESESKRVTRVFNPDSTWEPPGLDLPLICPRLVGQQGRWQGCWGRVSTSASPARRSADSRRHHEARGPMKSVSVKHIFSFTYHKSMAEGGQEKLPGSRCKPITTPLAQSPESRV